MASTSPKGETILPDSNPSQEVSCSAVSLSVLPVGLPLEDPPMASTSSKGESCPSLAATSDDDSSDDESEGKYDGEDLDESFTFHVPHSYDITKFEEFLANLFVLANPDSFKVEGAMCSFPSKVNSMVDSVTDTSSAVASALTSVTAFIQSFAASVSSTLEASRDQALRAKRIGIVTGQFIIAGVVSWYICKKFTAAKTIKAIVSIACLLKVVAPLLDCFLTKFIATAKGVFHNDSRDEPIVGSSATMEDSATSHEKVHVSDESDVKGHGLDYDLSYMDFDPLVNWYTQLKPGLCGDQFFVQGASSLFQKLMACVVVTTLKSLVPDAASKINALTSLIKVINPVSELLSTFGGLIGWVLEQFPDWIKVGVHEVFGWNSSDMSVYEQQLVVDCNKMVSQLTEDPLLLSKPAFCNLFAAKHKALNVANLGLLWTTNSVDAAVLRDIRGRMGQYLPSVLQATKLTTARATPTAVWLESSESGTGKSSVLPIIASYVTGITGGVWLRNVRARHDDGYVGQPAAGLEEMSTITGDAAKDVAAQMLQWIGPTETVSVQADLASKGKTLGCELFLFTTNGNLPGFAANLSNSQALVERFLRVNGFRIRVESLPEFKGRNGHINVRKVAEQSRADKTAFAHVRYRILEQIVMKHAADSVPEEKWSAPLTLFELLAILKTAHMLAQRQFQTRQDALGVDYTEFVERAQVDIARKFAVQMQEPGGLTAHLDAVPTAPESKEEGSDWQTGQLSLRVPLPTTSQAVNWTKTVDKPILPPAFIEAEEESGKRTGRSISTLKKLAPKVVESKGFKTANGKNVSARNASRSATFLANKAKPLLQPVKHLASWSDAKHVGLSPTPVEDSEQVEPSPTPGEDPIPEYEKGDYSNDLLDECESRSSPSLGTDQYQTRAFQSNTLEESVHKEVYLFLREVPMLEADTPKEQVPAIWAGLLAIPNKMLRSIQTLASRIGYAYENPMTALKMTWNSAAENLWARISGVSWKSFATLLSLASAGFVFYSMVKPDEEEDLIDAQGPSRKAKNNSRSAGAYGKRMRNQDRAAKKLQQDHDTGVHHFSSQLGEVEPVDEPDTVTAFRAKLNRNMRKLTRGDGSTLSGIMLVGRLMLTNRHFFMAVGEKGYTYIPDGTSFSVRDFNRSEATEYKFNSKNLSVPCNSDNSCPGDLCYYSLDVGHKGVDSSPSIVGFLPTRKDEGSVSTHPDAQLVFPGEELEFRDVGLATRKSVAHDWKRANGLNNTLINEVLEYKPNTAAGDCGSVLVTMGRQPRLLGIHSYVRSNGGRAYGTGLAVFREDVQVLLNCLSDSVIFAGADVYTPAMGPSIRAPDDNNVAIGRNHNLSHFVERPTKLVISPMADFVEDARKCTKELPPLTHKDPRLLKEYSDSGDFVLAAMSFSTPITQPFDPDLLALCVEDVVNGFPGGGRSLLTNSEALNGGGEFPRLGPLNMSTGGGVGWTSKSGGKMDFVRRASSDPDALWEYSEDRLPQRMLAAEVDLRNCKLPGFLTQIAVKDEPLSAAKVVNGQLRLIMVAELPALCLHRKYFGAIVNSFLGSGFDAGIAVGMDVYSSDWDDMQVRMRDLSPFGFGADLSKCDTRLGPQFWEAVIVAIEKWYSRQQDYDSSLARVRKGLMMELYMHMDVVGKDTFISFNNPTGTFLTTFMNCIYVLSTLRMCYVTLARRQSDSTLERRKVNTLDVDLTPTLGLEGFHSNVRPTAYGDDLFAAISDSVEWFNPLAIQRWHAEYGNKMTPPKKDEEFTEAYTSLDDLDFLSNSSRYDKKLGKWLAKVDPASIGKSMKFMQGNMDVVRRLYENSMCALGRAWGSGEEVYEKLRQECRTGLASLGVADRDFLTLYFMPPYANGYITFRNHAPPQSFDFEKNVGEVNFLTVDLPCRQTPDEADSFTVQMGQAASVSRVYNLSNVTATTLELGGDDPFEQGQSTSVDAQAGMDKPNVGLNAPPIYRVANPSYSNGCNVTYAQQLSINPGGQQGAEFADFSTSTDEMAISHVTQLNFSRSFNFNVDDAPGTILWKQEMTCAPSLLLASQGDTLEVPAIEVVSALFRRWTGGLKWRFQFVICGAGNVRVAFVTNYGGTGIPTTTVGALSQYSHVFDVTAENNTFDVEVPWRGRTQSLFVPNGKLDDSLYPYVSMGTAALLVLNAYRAPEAAPQRLDVNVYFGCGEGFKLDTYGESNYSLVSDVIAPESFKVQMMEGEASTSAVGVSFSETKGAVVADDGKVEANQEPAATVAIGENQLDFVKMAMRPQLVAILGWTVNQAEYTVLLRGRHPWDFIFGPAVATFNSFRFTRTGCRLTVQVKGTVFHAGSLILYYVPMTSVSEVTAHHAIHRPSQTIVSHAFIYAGDTGTATLDMPYVQLAQWLNTDATQDCGEIRLAVFNRLRTTSGSSEVTVSVFASFPDAEFKVVKPVNSPSSFREQADDFKVQMFSPGGPSSAQAPNAVQVVGADGSSGGASADPEIQSLRNICRRGHLVGYTRSSNPILTSVSSLVAQAPLDEKSASHWRKSRLSYISGMYRLWHGSPVYYHQAASDVSLIFRSQSIRASGSELFDFELLGPDPVSWCGPVDYGYSFVGNVANKIPFSTLYRALKVPKRPLDIGPEYNSGYLCAEALNASEKQPLRIYAHFGDNMRLGCLYAVPYLKVGTNVSPDTYS